MEQAHKRAISDGMLASTIDATVLRELLIEAHETAAFKYRKKHSKLVYVGMEQAIRKLAEPARIVKYHRANCRHFGVGKDDRLTVAFDQLFIRSYEECVFCAELSITEWSRQLGMDPSQVNAIVRKAHTRVRKSNAVKMFRAIGETPHPSLLGYPKKSSR